MSAHEHIGGGSADSLLALVGRTLPDGEASGPQDVATRAVDPVVHETETVRLLPTTHHARIHLARVEQMLLTMWSSRMPELGDGAADRLCAAHRAVHEAMLLLDDERIIADTGEMPVIR